MKNKSDKFVELNALRAVFIRRGRLEMLPKDIETLEYFFKAAILLYILFSQRLLIR